MLSVAQIVLWPYRTDHIVDSLLSASLRFEPFRIMNDTSPYPCTSSAVSWLQCLPTAVDAPVPDAKLSDPASLKKMERKASKATCCMKSGVAPHMCECSWAKIHPAVRQDSQMAMAKFSQVTGKAPMETTPTDADIISFGHEQYGLIPFEWYTQHIPEGVKRVLIVENFRSALFFCNR